MRKTKIQFGVVLIILLVILIGCSSPPPTVSVERICPTTTQSVLVNHASDPSKLIVVLVKEHPNYKEYAQQAFDILLEVFPKLLEPGDRVIMMTMEDSSLSDAIFFDGEISPLQKPAIVNSPTPPPTIGPLPSPTALPQGGYMEAVATQDAIRYMQGTQVAATAMAFEYACAQEEWKQNGEQIWRDWQTKRLKSISEFTDTLSDSINTNVSQGFQIKKSQVFEALQLASLLLRTECAGYDECHLVIFSDFYDYRIGTPPPINLMLDDIDVVGVLLNCQYKSECQDNLIWWQSYFDSLSVSQIEFVTGNKAEQTLLDHFRR